MTPPSLLGTLLWRVPVYVAPARDAMISRTCTGRVAFRPFSVADPHVALAHVELRSYGVAHDRTAAPAR
jgi:hypothetical protein